MTFNILLSRRWFCWQNFRNLLPIYIIDSECIHPSFYFIGREKMFHFPRINPFWVAACLLTTFRASLPQLTLPSLVSAIPFSLSMASLPSDFKYTLVSSQKAPQQKECWGWGNCSSLDSGGGYETMLTKTKLRIEHSKEWILLYVNYILKKQDFKINPHRSFS